MDICTFTSLKKENKLQSLVYTEYNLADDIEKIYSMNQEKIEDQDVVRNVIDHLFKKTFHFFMYEFLLYILGYFIPLCVQMYHEEVKVIIISHCIGLITSIILFCHEVIYYLDVGQLDYMNSCICWSMNNLSMIILYWIYCCIRLGSDKFSGNFLLVKNFEVELAH